MSAGCIEIRVGHGKAVLASSTTTLNAFRVSGEWTRDAAQLSGVRRPGTASQHYVGQYGNINGVLYMDSVAHEPGTFILLTAAHARGKTPASDGAIILRLRHGAPVLNVMANLPLAVDNYYGQKFCMFQGPADIMSIEEAELLGMRVPRGYVEKFFDPMQIQERFDVLELTPETAPRPELAVVTTATGVEVQEVAPAPARRMRLRK